ncbi:MAG: murein transglycosylase A [Alphaproteobacteria bacterium]|nr:murein transglycosylase A [Alphaproteobacteria bacterium]
MRFFLTFLALFLCSCAATGPAPSPDAPLKMSQNSFSALPGWQDENFRDLGAAYQKSCNVLLRRDSQGLMKSGHPEFGKYQEWQIVCRQFAKVNKTNPAAIRQFFESNFTPYSAHAGTNPEGLFTGYYEASLNGSRTRHGPYQYPLRARPDDLVMVNLGEFRDELKGQRIAGRVTNGRLKPYETHAEIINGALPKSQDRALVWVDSAIDAFFIQIQGSGVVRLDDGSIMRVGYAGQNGHPYYAIGRELVKRGQLSKDEVSLQTIRKWLHDHPTQAQDLMTTNKSYVFFEEQKGKGADEGPKGGSGLALTAMRSLAIDHSIIPYHMPVWLSAEAPNDGSQINRLMLTQDTGGAIRGPVRGDFFWGYGSKAEELAGEMKSKGRYWFLIPKNI